MVCLIKNRNKFYKKTLLDIWGHNILYKKYNNKLIHFMRIMYIHKEAKKLFFKREFVYSLKKRIRFRKKRKLKKKYIEHRYLYNYYLIVRRKNFIKYMYKARKKTGSFINNYLTFLEGRLFMLIYRANFINNIFKLKSIIDKGIFLINNKIKKYSNYNVKKGEIIQVNLKYQKILKRDMILRFINGNIIYNSPLYLYINYNFFFIFFLRAPKIKELIFPIRLDIYIGSNLYFL